MKTQMFSVMALLMMAACGTPEKAPVASDTDTDTEAVAAPVPAEALAADLVKASADPNCAEIVKSFDISIFGQVTDPEVQTRITAALAPASEALAKCGVKTPEFPLVITVTAGEGSAEASGSGSATGS
jgi:hypothetical protein